MDLSQVQRTSLFPPEKPRIQVQSCQPGGFSSCVHWPEVVPRVGKFQGISQSPLPQQNFPAFTYTNSACFLGQRELGHLPVPSTPCQVSLSNRAATAGQTLSGDLDCTFLSSPKCSLIQSENFTKLHLQQADSAEFSNCRYFTQHNFSSDISGISTAKVAI